MTPVRGQFRSTVVANDQLCREHYRLTLRTMAFPPTRPGQFVQVACRDSDLLDVGERELDWTAAGSGSAPPPALATAELCRPTTLLRRPFSLAGRRDRPDGATELDLIHRVVGVGTAWLRDLRPRDTVEILGPLGNTFTPPPPDGLAVLIGGGVGIPPMLYLAEDLARQGRKAVAFCGALSADLLPLTVTPRDPSAPAWAPLPTVAEFARHGIPAVVTTDDGSYGFRGFVTQALEQFLNQWSAGSGQWIVGDRDSRWQLATGNWQLITLYTCGPEPMMRRVTDIAAARGLAAQVAVERAMACGMGTCQSCVIRVRKPDPAKPPLAGSDWCFRLACTDGPVFAGADLLW